MCGGLSEVAARLKAEAKRQHFFELEETIESGVQDKKWYFSHCGILVIVVFWS
jgi:hypothetical protein